jgi:type IV secretory pathway TrbD component
MPLDFGVSMWRILVTVASWHAQIVEHPLALGSRCGESLCLLHHGMQKSVNAMSFWRVDVANPYNCCIMACRNRLMPVGFGVSMWRIVVSVASWHAEIVQCHLVLACRCGGRAPEEKQPSNCSGLALMSLS